MVTEAPSPLPASPLPGSETTSEYHPLCSIPTHTHFSFSVIGLSCCLFVCFVFKQGRERFGYPNPSPWGSSLKAVGMKEGLLPSSSELSASQRGLVGQGWLV